MSQQPSSDQYYSSPPLRPAYIPAHQDAQSPPPPPPKSVASFAPIGNDGVPQHQSLFQPDLTHNPAYIQPAQQGYYQYQAWPALELDHRGRQQSPTDQYGQTYRQPPPPPPPPPQFSPTSMHHESAEREEPLPPENWVPEILQDKSKLDLEAFLSDPSLITALLHHPSISPPALVASQTPLQHQLEKNTQLAQSVVELEHTLKQKREQATQRLLKVRAQEQAWRKRQKEMDDRLEVFGMRSTYQRLGNAITEGEGVCKAIEEGWLEEAGRNGSGPLSEREVEDWIKRVREGRRLVWLRKERKGRWDEGRVGGWR